MEYCRIYAKAWLIILLSFFLISCANHSTEKSQETSAFQPGEKIYVYLETNTEPDHNIESVLKHYTGDEKLVQLIEKYNTSIASLYEKKVLNYSDSRNQSGIDGNISSLSSSEVTALFALFPLDTAKWMKKVSTHSMLSKNEIYESAIAAGLDPSIVFAASASGFSDTATPLINSIGIVIYGQDEDSVATVQFKAHNETNWQKGLDLSWEPIYGSYAGSLVYLEADTTYDIQVQITNVNGDIAEHTFQSKTKANTPLIDTSKVYYLSEIYSGGQLDLEALNIEGGVNGYAKIIGDGPIIDAGSDVLSAVNIGNNSYVMLENLTIRGGQRYGILAQKAHHIWIKGCNISGYGREAVDIRNGKAYSSPTSSSPINYDSGIYLERSGIAVIEECEIHSPNLGANNWSVGHPKGANALQVWAYHDSDEYRGEFIVRNNRFYGAPNHRFNDVIEGRMNFERRGGFVRNSAIYGNYLAYANDDLIEIDGGQQNVLVYNNEMEQGYAGVSVAPNMLGPSYIFHNHIHNLGDDRGKEWTAIKAGGLMSKPGGRTYVFENFIDVNRNGIASSDVNGDSTFWITSQNNIIFTKYKNNNVGYCILDKEKYIGSSSINDLCYNEAAMDSRYDFDMDNLIEHPYSDNYEYIAQLKNTNAPKLEVQEEFRIPNFSPTGNPMLSTRPSVTSWQLNAYEIEHSGFANQYRYGATVISEDNTVTLTGNNWRMFPVDYTLTKDSVLSLVLEVEGNPDIVGVGFETDTKLSSSRIVKFYGTQNWGVRAEEFYDLEKKKVLFPVGQHITGKITSIILVLDNDNVKSWKNIDRAEFKTLEILEN